MKKRIISALACLSMALCLFPTALAYGGMDYSDECIEFIKEHEGFADSVYDDGTGWYIGYGSAVDGDAYPDGLTEADAEELLRDKMDEFAEYVNAFLDKYDVSVTQGQFDALCSMTYNFGPSWLSTANRLPSYLANGIEGYTDREIVNAFAAWCHFGGEINEGLLKRRIAEAQMFLYDDYSFDTSGWVWLSIDSAGGDIISDVSCFERGESYGALPEATKSGYDFAGWYTSSGRLLSESDTAKSSISVTAAWVKSGASTAPSVSEKPDYSEESVAEDKNEPEKPDESTFSDAPASAWYSGYVSELAEAGVVSGYPDGSFRPQNDVSYAEAFKLIILAAGYSEQAPLDGGHWASGYFDFAQKQGFSDGGEEVTPDRAISRIEIARLAARCLGLSADMSLENPFFDTGDASVIALYQAGIVEGSFEGGNRVFKGGDSITRAEISAIVWRIREYVSENLIIFSGYRLPLDQSLEQNPYDSEDFYSENGRVYYSGDEYEAIYGIDVSFYQNDIDWELVRADGIDFAIIRGGYRGCSEGEIFTDERFYEYIEGALDAGIEVGLYFFSQAVDEDEAREEAEYLISLAEDYDISYPLVFDWEPLNYSYSRTNNFDYSVLTDCALAFCETVEAAGYTPMVYLNPTFGYLRYDLSELQDIDIWLAHYTENTNYRYGFKIWQYGSSGNVEGIEGRVDMDIAFFDYAG